MRVEKSPESLFRFERFIPDNILLYCGKRNEPLIPVETVSDSRFKAKEENE